MSAFGDKTKSRLWNTKTNVAYQQHHAKSDPKENNHPWKSDFFDRSHASEPIPRNNEHHKPPKRQPATGKTPAKSTKTSPLNPDWIKELLESAGFPAAIAEALAPAVTITMSEDIRRKYNATKVSRFAK